MIAVGEPSGRGYSSLANAETGPGKPVEMGSLGILGFLLRQVDKVLAENSLLQTNSPNTFSFSMS